MDKTLKRLGMVLTLTGCGIAHAGSADSTGGIKAKSDDGRFEASLGGRLQYDYATFQKDVVQTGYSAGPYVRRAYLTLTGKVFEFRYKLEVDAAGSALASKDMWIGADVLAGFIKAGHMQPAYGMEEMTSSNELLFVERPFISSSVLFTGREFQNAISYDTHAVPGLMAMAAVYEANTGNDKDAGAKQPSTANGHGYSARVTYAPVVTDAVVVHVGASYDDVAWKTGAGANAPAVAAPYVAKNGPTLPLIAVASYDGQITPTGEVALRFGPFFLQGEYAQAKYAFTTGPDQDVTAWYAQASVFVTGEAKPYKAAGGVFGNPKPAHVEFGALELKARYDHVQNDDAAARPEATMTSFGINYYFNPNLRIMADYNFGTAETLTTKDEPKAVVVRGQIHF